MAVTRPYLRRLGIGLWCAVIVIGMCFSGDVQARKKRRGKRKPARTTQVAPAPEPAPSQQDDEDSSSSDSSSNPWSNVPSWAGDQGSSGSSSYGSERQESLSSDEVATETTQRTSSKSHIKPSTWEVRLGVRGFRRELSVSGGAAERLNNYVMPGRDLPISAQPALEAAFYPWEYVGILVEGGYVPVQTLDLEQRLHWGHSYDASLGARPRLVWNRLDIGLPLMFGVQGFDLGIPSSSSAPRTTLSTLYVTFRPGISAKIRLVSWLDLLLRGGYVVAFSSGDASSLYPGASSMGFDVGGGLVAHLFWKLELQLTFDWRRYYLSLPTGGPLPAGAATDDYLNTTLMVGFRH